MKKDQLGRVRRTVAIFVFDDVEVLDFSGPFEVYSVADKLHEHGVFNVVTVGRTRSMVRAVNGLKVTPDYGFDDCPKPDVLVVPGGIGTRPLLNEPSVLQWLRAKSVEAEIVESVCTGALLLGKAGLLDGLRITTHHLALDLLKTLAPAATVDPTQRFHDNGKFCTAAGISAGIDLSLHLVGKLLGDEAASATARQMEYEYGR
jgi:transcriptional regulator GlxA family with amidase domain